MRFHLIAVAAAQHRPYWALALFAAFVSANLPLAFYMARHREA